MQHSKNDSKKENKPRHLKTNPVSDNKLNSLSKAPTKKILGLEENFTGESYQISKKEIIPNRTLKK